MWYCLELLKSFHSINPKYLYLIDFFLRYLCLRMVQIYPIGESKTESDFLNRPFAKGYKQDRLILERSWATHKMFPVFNVSSTQLDKFEPYEDKDILEKSQSNKGIWD